MNPVCSQCHCELECIKNGVTVASVHNESHQRSGDEFHCPNCGFAVIINLGEAFQSEIEPDVSVL